MPPPTDVSSPDQATDGRALRGSLARNVLADTTSGARKGGLVRGSLARNVLADTTSGARKGGLVIVDRYGGPDVVPSVNRTTATLRF
jgi:hypothetical protein